MDRVEPDETPAEAWKSSLGATCNRLTSHYLSLLRAASSEDAASGGAAGGTVGTDPRAGGGPMRDAADPPPPLAADVQLSAVQAKLAAENLCVASSNALDLIRTLRLSALLMDEELIRAEEEEEALELCEAGLQAEEECASLEEKLMELRNKELKR
ncbi:hypothetical protein ACHAXT_007027 [Thalassiosira profunda]